MKRQTLWRMLLAAFFLLMLAGSAAQAANITVDGSVCTLAEAITSANNDNAAGNGCVNGSGADTITLQADVTLAAALPQVSSTIIIEGGGHFISGNRSYRVLYITNTGNLTLNETTVKDGKTDPRSPYGGGIYNSGGTVTLNSSTISGNTASSAGGGILNHGGIVTLNNTTISGNTSSSGGGIYNNGTVTLNNAIVSGNTAASKGEGIFNYGGGTVTLNNSTVSGNTSSSSTTSAFGGGIYNDSGTVTLTNSTVSDNTISSSYSLSATLCAGGGIYNFGGAVTLINSTVSGNIVSTAIASSNGGGIFNYGGGTVTLKGSTVNGNTISSATSSSGGGISNWDGIVTLTNSTVSENTATTSSLSSPVGGGIFNHGTVTLTNSTVSGNTVSASSYSFSGGIYNNGKITLQGSIISGNTATKGKEICRPNGSIIADSFNVFGHNGETSDEAFSGFTPGASDVTATSNGGVPTALNIILSPLANNGGPTQTHALPEGSPAIDLDTTCAAGTDQRGMPRPFGAGCDAGSFELQATNQAPVADAGDNQSVVQGEEVCFDGSGSTDADNDPLSYLWTFTEWPAGSAAELDNPTVDKPCLIADLAGTYQVSLIVNDGTVDSTPSTAEAVAISCQDVAREAVKAVNALDPSVFDNKNNQKNLTKGILEVIALVDQQLYAEALLKLEGGSVLGKTKGCAIAGAPDNDDWIKDCASQAQVYPLLQQTIVCVQRL